MSTLARTRSVALTVAWRSIHNAFINPAILLPSVMFPLLFFIAFAGGLSGVQNAPDFDFKSGYTSFQFAFVASSRPRSAACSRASRSPPTSSSASPAGCCSQRPTAAGSSPAT